MHPKCDGKRDALDFELMPVLGVSTDSCLFHAA